MFVYEIPVAEIRKFHEKACHIKSDFKTKMDQLSYVRTWLWISWTVHCTLLNNVQLYCTLKCTFIHSFDEITRTYSISYSGFTNFHFFLKLCAP